MKRMFFTAVIIFAVFFAGYSFAQELTLDQIFQQTQQQSAVQISKKDFEEATKNIQGQAFEQIQEQNIIEIEGTIDSIAEDKSSIVVDKNTISINSELLTYSKVQQGDKVIVVAAKTDEGIKAIGINFADQEQAETSETPGNPGIEEADSEDYTTEDIQEDERVLEDADTEEEQQEEEIGEEESFEVVPQDLIEEE